MSAALGERRVQEQDGAIALIVRKSRRLWPWDVWVIVPQEKREGSRYRDDSDDPTYGHPGFRAICGLRQFYIEDITSRAARYGSAMTEAGAERRARRKLARFLRWRDRQRAIEASMQEPEAA